MQKDIKLEHSWLKFLKEEFDNGRVFYLHNPALATKKKGK